jgi:hypothetical protein
VQIAIAPNLTELVRLPAALLARTAQVLAEGSYCITSNEFNSFGQFNAKKGLFPVNVTPLALRSNLDSGAMRAESQDLSR